MSAYTGLMAHVISFPIPVYLLSMVVSTLHAIISAGVAKQRDIGRADQIRHRVLGGRQTETCPLPP